VVAERRRGGRLSAVGLAIEERSVSVWDGTVELGVHVAGSGPPLVYLHPAPGLAWDPFLERLAEERTIYAPQVPGTTPGRPEQIQAVDDLWDLVLLYEEAIRRLGLDRPEAIGHSFGGMLACELAAAYPQLFGRLVAICPIGLWRDDAPVANWVAAAPEEMPGLVFHDPESEAAQAVFGLPENPEEMIGAIAGFTWAVGCTAKFVWPIPEKGLAKRLHRIEIPTLFVWGRDDRLVPVVYAEEFGRRVAGSRVEVLGDCGHIPQLEQPEKTFALVSEFLAG
jgi:pimeloyl-ACP methyl ester carboxylesterase